MSVNFVEYFDGINEDMFINIIHCSAMFTKYDGASTAYWVERGGNPEDCAEAALEKFMQERFMEEIAKGKKNFVRIEIRLMDRIDKENSRMILVKGTRKK